jgi:hypothetical protein
MAESAREAITYLAYKNEEPTKTKLVLDESPGKPFGKL